MCMSKPSTPAPPPVPTPASIPILPAPEDPPEVPDTPDPVPAPPAPAALPTTIQEDMEAAKEQERKRQAAKKGRRSTLLTDPSALSRPDVDAKKLLGQ